MAPDQASSFPYQDPHLNVEQRMADLLARMSLEDKSGMMFHDMVAPGDVDALNSLVSLPSTRTLVSEFRLRHFNLLGAAPDGRQFAQWHNQLQRLAAEQPLAIPVTISSDPRHHFTDNPMLSIMAGPFSQWPEPLGLAAIGSEELLHQFADIARQEYGAVGIRVALHPQIDLATEARWPRISQTFGEDADLTSRLAAAYIRGFQGDTLGPESVATMTKHFPGGGPQKDGSDPHFAWGREQVYPGGFFEYHLRPFRAALAAGTSQIMPYYGMPVGTEYEEVGFSFNRSVITGLLREELGFDGIVCTDWGLIIDAPEPGPLSAARAWGVEHLSPEERMLKLLDAGVDQFGGECCSDMLVRLVKTGKVSEVRIDESVRRLVREKFILGLFDGPYVDEEVAAVTLGRSDFRAAGIRAQQRALTLLTNKTSVEGMPTLPLQRGTKVYAEGSTHELLASYATVVSDPSDADVAILRLKAPWEPSGHGGFVDLFHGGSLEFEPDEVARVERICRAVPTVIDFYLERPAVVTPLATAAAAIIGNYGINEAALWEVIFGEALPEGNLPFDLPRSMAAVVVSNSDAPFDTEDPLFRFGHGLRYDTTHSSEGG
jgi:beta-glucosidase